jgi:hypothetical protein
MIATEEPLPPKDGAVPNLGTSSNSSTDYKSNNVPADFPASSLRFFSSPHSLFYLITHNLPDHDTPGPGHEKTGEDTYYFTFEPKNPSVACRRIRIEGHTQNAGTYRHGFRSKNSSGSRGPSTDAHSVRHLTHDTFYRPENRVATRISFPESLLGVERDVRSTHLAPTQSAKRAKITTPIGSPGSTVPDSLDGSFTQGPKRQRDLEDEPGTVDVLKKCKVK